MKELKINRVILTTDYKSYLEVKKIVEKYGLKPLLFNCIKIKRLKFKIPDKKYDWIFFTSKNAVRIFLNQSKWFLKGKKIAAIGPATLREIEKMAKRSCDYIPPDYNSVSFVKSFVSKYKFKKFNILFLTSDLTDDYIQNNFLKYGHHIDKIIVYRTIKPRHSDYRIKLLKKNIKNSFIIFSSSSSLYNFIDTVSLKLLKYPYIITMGIKTEKSLKKLGFKSFIKAKSSFEDIISKIRKITTTCSRK